jgi:hypothetical protein
MVSGTVAVVSMKRGAMFLADERRAFEGWNRCSRYRKVHVEAVDTGMRDLDVVPIHQPWTGTQGSAWGRG